MRLRVLGLGLVLWACGGGDPLPPDPRTGVWDVDLGWPPIEDAGTVIGEDTAVSGNADLGDASPDGGPSEDGSADGGPAPDLGSRGWDDDGDTIRNIHEGQGELDTDRDGIPDTLDLDSDGDGIPDRTEAGDADPISPPRDTDRDGTPDARDLDADGDGLTDRLEGDTDTDGDGRFDAVDLDSDGDGILDAREGEADTDRDGVLDFRDRDADGDGVSDAIERLQDPDQDGVPAYLDLDADGDGILDQTEGALDPDGDGRPSFVDLDADGDGIDDFRETDRDTDGDGLPDYLDLDSDGDGIADRFETDRDADGDGAYNAVDLDSDDDGISDATERRRSDPGVPPNDTDGDGIPDFVDLDSDDDLLSDAQEGLSDHDQDGLVDAVDSDSDGDALLDLEERGELPPFATPVDTDGDGRPDHLDLDSDGDTIADLDEGRADSDGDGVLDRRSLDADGDGLSDSIEAGDADLATPPVDTDLDGVPDYRDLDADDDGLTDDVELGCPGSTERLALDSDSDGYQDTAEVAVGTDPCDPGSGLDAFYFVLADTGTPDSDFLRFDDTGVDQADVVLNVDTTGSMTGEISTLRSSLSSFIVPGVQAVVPDPAFAVTTFQDFPLSPFGSGTSGDLPFELEQRVTTDTGLVQTVLDGLSIRNGRDTRESGLEALHQIAEGSGVRWGPGSMDRVEAFDPSVDRVPSVADGTIGGVGHRNDSLRVIVHVTDAPSHLAEDYPAAVTSAAPSAVVDALDRSGSRVVTITETASPRPWTDRQLQDRFDDFCNGLGEPVLGILEGPQGSDSDWYELDGAASGDRVVVSVEAFRVGSALDAMVAVYDGSGNQLGFSNDRTGSPDPELDLTLSGTGPFYVAVSAFNDLDFNGSGAVSAGHFFLDVEVDGSRYVPATLGCPATDVGDDALQADRWVSASSAGAAGPGCEAHCWDRVADEAVRTSYGISRVTRARVPPCAWDRFGSARPAGCSATECCTGPSGAGTPTDVGGQCPLSFEIADDGSGIDQALVTAIEALVQFSEFRITTRIRPDPAALANQVDTRCFIQRVTPDVATPPNPCAPTPVATDTSTAIPGLDTFERVVPGTTLRFEVVAANRSVAGGPCAPGSNAPQTFRAFIDVLADGVAQLATRDVVIVVPPAQRTAAP